MRIVPADFEARRAALRAANGNVSAALADALGERRRPSRIIAEQRKVIAEQEALIELLKGALAADGRQSEIPAYRPWMETLTPQERALMGAMHRAYPRPLSKETLLDLMPGHDHVEDRCAKLVTVKICHLRRKLGQDAIEHVRGIGYRLSAEQHAAMRPTEPAPAAMKLAA